MTVVLASKYWATERFGYSPGVVMASDQSVTFRGYFKSQGQLLKFAFFAPGWRGLLTGDPDRAGDIIRHVVATFASDPQTIPSVDEISKACCESFVAIPAQNADQVVSFLVCGVSAGEPHLLTIEDPGVSTRRSTPFWADGYGDTLALHALGSSSQGIDLYSTIYRVCAAKFEAESAEYVDKFTSLSWMDSSGSERPVSDAIINQLRDVWEASKKYPKRADEILRTEFPEFAATPPSGQTT